MLEKIDLDLSVPEEDYRKRIPVLQQRLYGLEHALFRADVPVMVVFEGWAAAGKGGTIAVLSERLDARGFRVETITPPRTAELQYPWLWRYWLKIPAAGQMIIFDNSWYRRVLIDRVAKTVDPRDCERAFQDIRSFEEQLTADGMAIVKFWLHIDKKEQTRRFRKLLKHRLTAWQVSEEDAVQHKAYDAYLHAAEEMLARTDSPFSPWTIVEAHDRYHTRIKVLETLIGALESRLGMAPGGSMEFAQAEEVAKYA